MPVTLRSSLQVDSYNSLYVSPWTYDTWTPRKQFGVVTVTVEPGTSLLRIYIEGAEATTLQADYLQQSQITKVDIGATAVHNRGFLGRVAAVRRWPCGVRLPAVAAVTVATAATAARRCRTCGHYPLLSRPWPPLATLAGQSRPPRHRAQACVR